MGGVLAGIIGDLQKTGAKHIETRHLLKHLEVLQTHAKRIVKHKEHNAGHEEADLLEAKSKLLAQISAELGEIRKEGEAGKGVSHIMQALQDQFKQINLKWSGDEKKLNQHEGTLNTEHNAISQLGGTLHNYEDLADKSKIAIMELRANEGKAVDEVENVERGIK